MLDHAEALYLLSELIHHQKERLPAAYTSEILRNGVSEVGIFVDTSLLRKLASGCKELLQMVTYDRFSAFRGTLCDGWPSRQEPLLDDHEDRAVRWLAHKIISIVDDGSECVAGTLPAAAARPDAGSSGPSRT